MFVVLDHFSFGVNVCLTNFNVLKQMTGHLILRQIYLNK